MKAVCWEGKKNVQVKEVPQPKLLNPRDAIIRVTSTAICGSDLHLYGGFIPTMESGDILGHEFMGVVVETGSEVKKLRVGDRVIVPFTISCGACFFCLRGMTSACDNTNPNAAMAEKVNTFTGAGLFGYAHMNGGYAGGQAEYVRVPFADVGPFKIPDDVEDDRALFLTDIFPTGYMAAENCNIQNGDTVAVFGCGPVGQFAIRSAFILGASRVIGIDTVPERLNLARSAGAEVLDESQGDVIQRLAEMTGGMGPDSCIDAVGLEAHGHGLTELYDQVKQAVYLETDRPIVLRTALMACRKGGTISIPGVYAGIIDKVPMGVAFAKGLTLKMGQTHVHRYLPQLLRLITSRRIDPSFVITHRQSLDEAPAAYATFLEKKDHCIKVVLKP